MKKIKINMNEEQMVTFATVCVHIGGCENNFHACDLERIFSLKGKADSWMCWPTYKEDSLTVVPMWWNEHEDDYTADYDCQYIFHFPTGWTWVRTEGIPFSIPSKKECAVCKHYLIGEDMCGLCMQPLWGKDCGATCTDFE